MDNLIVRKASKEDLRDVVSLYADVDIDKEETLSVDEAVVIFNKFNTYPDYSLYVACIDNKIVGTFELLIMDNLGHKGRLSGIVEDVVVHKDYRSHGIGAKMMEHAIGICRALDCYKLSLSSNLKRERAHKFYENFGFKKHGYSFLMELE